MLNVTGSTAPLSLSEQITLFEFIKDHDRTDWDNLPVCMNPTPKTLQFC